jgi:hypothetical protein
MDIKDLRPLQYVRDGLTLLRISSVYPNRVTAQVLLLGRPSMAPSRTSVRTFTAEHVEMFFSPATAGQMKALDEIYGLRSK